MTVSNAAQDMAWMVESLIDKAPGTAHAIVVSSDGLTMAASGDLPPERADQLASVTSGVMSMALAVARFAEGGRVIQSIVEMADGYFVIMSISDGSCLAVLAAMDASIDVVAYEMAALVTKLGSYLTPELRSELVRYNGVGPEGLPAAPLYGSPGMY